MGQRPASPWRPTFPTPPVIPLPITAASWACGSSPAGGARAVEAGLRGGLVVAPAAPALTALSIDPAYRQALTGADLSLTDSGLMVLLWRLAQGEKLPRVSGLRYLKGLLDAPALRQPGATLWVLPSADAKAKTLVWLRGLGFAATDDDCYVAPLYGTPVADAALLALVNLRKPAHIIVGIGGGTQEKLGLYLKQGVEYRPPPGIHCIGAAVGFLNGDQAPIPEWADRFYLGWLLRSLAQPTKFTPRLWKTWRLPWMLWRHRRALPPLMKA